MKKIKRGLTLLAIFVVIIAVLYACGSNRKPKEDASWDKIKLADKLPETDFEIEDLVTNTKENLVVYTENVTQDDYDNYLKECKSFGYNVESEESDRRYSAFNKDGYALDLLYYDDDEELHITLDAPIEMSELRWPNSDIAKAVPQPKSTIGSISWERADGFYLYVGETNKDDFNAYADECSAKGFNVDYERGDTYYRADNQDGYHLSISYKGNNVISIQCESKSATDTPQPATDAPQSATEEPAPTSAPASTVDEPSSGNTSTNLVDGMRPEFKEAVDSYEEFMNEYCEFMEKYSNSDDTVSMLSDYMKFLEKYQETSNNFNKLGEEEMNTAELAYYTEVNARVLNKISSLNLD